MPTQNKAKEGMIVAWVVQSLCPTSETLDLPKFAHYASAVFTSLAKTFPRPPNKQKEWLIKLYLYFWKIAGKLFLPPSVCQEFRHKT